MNSLAEFDLKMPNRIPGVIGVHRTDETVRAAIAAISRLRGTDAAASIPADEIFTFSAEVSNQNLDSHFTRMAKNSLQNYSEDATTGVAFMHAHNHGSSPIGYSTRGMLTGETDNPSVLADFYTVRGLETVDGYKTDGFIRAVETGLVRDVSIGFKYGPDFMMRCSICGGDIFDWRACDHFPGVKYDVTANPEADPSEQQTTQVTCFAWVEDARLSEVSAVFDGSTPDAMLTKATLGQRAGTLTPDVERFLKSTYRIELPTPWRKGALTELGKNNKQERQMDKEETSGAPDNTALANLRNAEARLEARSCGVKVDDKATAEDVLRALRAEVERLQPFESQATDATTLRKVLVDEAIAEGVRAHGEDFKEPEMRTMLENMPVEVMRSTRDAWKQVADKTFGSGRQTKDNPDKPERDVTDNEADVEDESFELAEGAV